mgnify:CR=1 FL=1
MAWFPVSVFRVFRVFRGPPFPFSQTRHPRLGSGVIDFIREIRGQKTRFGFRLSVSPVIRGRSELARIFGSSPRLGPAGEIIGVCGEALAITHRKEAERSLSRSEERLRATYDHAPVGIAEANLKGTLVAANAKFCTQLGFNREELIGRSIVEITHPDDVATTEKNQAELVQGLVPFYASEKRYRHKTDISFGLLPPSPWFVMKTAPVPSRSRLFKTSRRKNAPTKPAAAWWQSWRTRMTRSSQKISRVASRPGIAELNKCSATPLPK